jgi:DNA gyrase subunit B
VRDNGRGIPVDMHATTKKPALEVVMTTLHAGGKFDNDSYKVSGGLHGVGVSCVNALSSACSVEVLRDGKAAHPVVRARHPDRPDELAAGGQEGEGQRHDRAVHADRRSSRPPTSTGTRSPRACANSRTSTAGLTIHLKDERSGKAVDYLAKGGIAEFVKFLNTNKETLHSKPVVFQREARQRRGGTWRSSTTTPIPRRCCRS